MSMTFDPLQSLLAAIVCLLLGAAVNRKVDFLTRYNIPDPVTGGLLFAIFVSLAVEWGDAQVSLNATMKPVLLLMFFAGVGLAADLRLLKVGGKALAIFMVVLFPFLILQNVVGVLAARALDLHPIFGLIAGSITLVGGHGTGAAYAERFAEVNNLQSVMELSMTSATIGLVLGGIVAGPVAQYLINRYKPRARSRSALSPEIHTEDKEEYIPISALGVMGALAGILFAVLFGQWLADRFHDLPVTIPGFVWCLIVGVVIRNVLPLVGLDFDDRATELIANVSLALFLVMTMMALNLVEVVLTAGPLVVIVLLQVVFIVAYAIWVCFRFMGRDYEAVTTTAGFIGFNLGSTATAIANMQAITTKYGPAPKSFLIVPLAGAFFVDLLNAAVLTVFLSLGFIGG